MPPSRAQLEKHIRASAENTANVYLTRHAQTRMRERRITWTMLYEALQQGVIDMPPEPDIRHPGVKCRMRRYVAGLDVGAVVYVEHPRPELLVITVIDLD